VIHIAFALIIVFGIASITYLVIQGHPWFALLIVLILSGLRMSHKN